MHPINIIIHIFTPSSLQITKSICNFRCSKHFGVLASDMTMVDLGNLNLNFMDGSFINGGQQ